jgi:DNA-binding response OmpR family regulator
MPNADAPLVLVADDEREVAGLVAVILSRAGVRATTAVNGTEALEVIAERSPDAAVLDIMMPDMNGYEVVQRVRSDPTTSSMPLILLSARAGKIDRDYGLRIGADAYFRKPFDPQALVETLRTLIEAGRDDTV